MNRISAVESQYRLKIAKVEELTDRVALHPADLYGLFFKR